MDKGRDVPRAHMGPGLRTSFWSGELQGRHVPNTDSCHPHWYVQTVQASVHASLCTLTDEARNEYAVEQATGVNVHESNHDTLDGANVFSM